MTTPIVKGVTDEELDKIEQDALVHCEGPWPEETLRLIARLRAAEADAKRLEWMINEGCIVQHQNGTASPTVFRVYWPALAEQQPEWYPTDRAAIDAAMEQSK